MIHVNPTWRVILGDTISGMSTLAPGSPYWTLDIDDATIWKCQTTEEDSSGANTGGAESRSGIGIGLSLNISKKNDRPLTSVQSSGSEILRFTSGSRNTKSKPAPPQKHDGSRNGVFAGRRTGCMGSAAYSIRTGGVDTRRFAKRFTRSRNGRRSLVRCERETRCADCARATKRQRFITSTRSHRHHCWSWTSAT